MYSYPNWKQLKFMSTGEKTNKSVYIHAIEGNSAIKSEWTMEHMHKHGWEQIIILHLLSQTTKYTLYNFIYLKLQNKINL